MPARFELRELRSKELRIPFKVAFRHAAAERSETSSLWVEAVSSAGMVGYGESCPRPYVTGETIESAQSFVSRSRQSLCSELVDLASLRAWMASHADALNEHPAGWCAVELAVLDLLAKASGRTVEAFLSLPPLAGTFRYTAVLGDSDLPTFERTVDQYCRRGFCDFKIKLSGNLERDRAKLGVLHAHGVPIAAVRADANNLWPDAEAAIEFLRALEYPLCAIEEPVRANRYEDLARIADAIGSRMVLDESFVRIDQLAYLSGAPARWLLNVRVSKMGGLLRSLEIVEKARAAGIGVIVGAQVGETSLLTRAALTVAHQARDVLVAQEGAFGTFLLASDICEPPIMFGAGGILDVSAHPSVGRPGFGFQNPTV
jgi:L-alanine-DL-glutamate epimerase-like enolase superfamily enzyme